MMYWQLTQPLITFHKSIISMKSIINLLWIFKRHISLKWQDLLIRICPFLAPSRGGDVRAGSEVRPTAKQITRSCRNISCAKSRAEIPAVSHFSQIKDIFCESRTPHHTVIMNEPTTGELSAAHHMNVYVAECLPSPQKSSKFTFTFTLPIKFFQTPSVNIVNVCICGSDTWFPPVLFLFCLVKILSIWVILITSSENMWVCVVTPSRNNHKGGLGCCGVCLFE